MHDQRVNSRAAFGDKDFGNCGVIVCIGSQTVDRLGWKAKNASSPRGCYTMRY